MNRLLSSLLESLKMSKGVSTVHRRRRRARLNVECLDERQLMTASLAPGNLLIYYGFPSLINNAQGNLSTAASTLGSYSMVVLGDTLELPTNADHANTQQIIASTAMKNTLVFGYVDTGVSTQNLSTNQMTTEVNDWKAMGAKGIFLDDFGYDFGTTRARQNAFVSYAHSQGLVVMANAWVPADAFGNAKSSSNPSGTATALNASDYYLFESYQVDTSSYVPVATWQSKATQLATYQAAIGFKVAAVTTPSQANVFSQSQFNYAWYSALEAGYAAVGWGEFDYASDTCVVPTTVPSSSPAPSAVGTSFSGGIVQSGNLFTRNTNLGQIQVNATSYTGSFTPLPAAPSFKGSAVSPTQINLSWNAASGATGYVVDELVSGSWKQIASLGGSSLTDNVTGLASGTSYTFKVAATNVAGTVFTAQQTIETFTAAPTLTATAASTTQINLGWTAVTGATGYVVDELIGGVWTPIKTFGSGTTSFSVLGLTHAVTYQFKVGAVDSAGTEFSSIASAKTK